MLRGDGSLLFGHSDSFNCVRAANKGGILVACRSSGVIASLASVVASAPGVACLTRQGADTIPRLAAKAGLPSMKTEPRHLLPSMRRT